MTRLIITMALAIACIVLGVYGITFHPETTWDCRFNNCLFEVNWTALLLFPGLYLAVRTHLENRS